MEFNLNCSEEIQVMDFSSLGIVVLVLLADH
jgi:hypothetical protein